MQLRMEQFIYTLEVNDIDKQKTTVTFATAQPMEQILSAIEAYVGGAEGKILSDRSLSFGIFIHPGAIIQSLPSQLKS